MATLQDAITNVRCLEALALPDEQPTIEPEAASVVYEVSFDTNFADRTAFITGIGKFNEEATVCSSLVGVLSVYCACVWISVLLPPRISLAARETTCRTEKLGLERFL